jgi:hypothetical protein
VTASFDAARDKEGKIVPGIGEFEGRYAGAPSSVVALPAAAEDVRDPKKSITSKITSLFSRG